MPYFSQEALKELYGLIDQGLHKLDTIEREINVLTQYTVHPTPEARAVAAALRAADVDQQLDFIGQARRTLIDIRAKLGLDDFDDNDAEDVCQVLDRVKIIAREMNVAAQAYSTSMQRIAETN